VDPHATRARVLQNTEIRIIQKGSEPWFVAKDVCDALDLSNSRKATQRLDGDEKNTVTISDGTPGNPNKTVINEAGLYRLIFTLQKDEAKRFKRWIAHDALPSIRKTGLYAARGGRKGPDGVMDAIVQKSRLVAQSIEQKTGVPVAGRLAPSPKAWSPIRELIK
jgi:prophage antirepressor-like protein